MTLTNINPGIKLGRKQPYTITFAGQIFFTVHDEATDEITFNAFAEPKLKSKVEKALRSYLTNRK